MGAASPKRLASFETVPTLAEQGMKGFEAYADVRVAAGGVDEHEGHLAADDILNCGRGAAVRDVHKL